MVSHITIISKIIPYITVISKIVPYITVIPNIVYNITVIPKIVPYIGKEYQMSKQVETLGTRLKTGVANNICEEEKI